MNVKRRSWRCILVAVVRARHDCSSAGDDVHFGGMNYLDVPLVCIHVCMAAFDEHKRLAYGLERTAIPHTWVFSTLSRLLQIS